jgi:hypothetical protein
MNKLLLNGKDRSVYCSVVGFKDGEEAVRPSGVDVVLKLLSGAVCEINWHKLNINNENIDFQYVRKFKKDDKQHNKGLLIESVGCSFLHVKYIGYIDGKKCFMARSKSLSRPKMYFSGKVLIDDVYGEDSWQSVALLCWWMMYRD